MTLGRAVQRRSGGAQAVGTPAQELRVPVAHQELADHRQCDLRPAGPAAEHPRLLPDPGHVQPVVPGDVAEGPDRQGHVPRDARDHRDEAPAPRDIVLRAGHRRRHGGSFADLLRHLRCGGQPRIWVAENPRTSRIVYLAPSGRTVGRLKQYGVPDERIWVTGFPLPTELLGDRTLSVLRQRHGAAPAPPRPGKPVLAPASARSRALPGRGQLPAAAGQGRQHHLRHRRRRRPDGHRPCHGEQPAAEDREGRPCA